MSVSFELYPSTIDEFRYEQFPFPDCIYSKLGQAKTLRKGSLSRYTIMLRRGESRVGGEKPDLSVDYALLKIDEAFKAIDISSPLVTAKDEKEAKKIRKKYGYDRIPLNESGSIKRYVDFSNGSEVKRIEPSNILSSHTGILQILTDLSRQDFYFLINGNQLTHFINYSDLNHPLMLIGIYTQIAYCEIEIRKMLRIKVSQGSENRNDGLIEDFLKKYLSKDKVKRAKKRYEEKKKANIQTDMIDELHFDDELTMSKGLKLTDIEEVKIEEYTRLRNAVMHGKPNIIKQKEDIVKWLTFVEECKNITRKIRPILVKR